MHKPKYIRCGVFSTSYENAERYINFIYEIATRDGTIVDYKKSKYDLSITLKDGTNYVYINPNLGIRGLRCSKAIIDIDTITVQQIQTQIKPVCIYCEESDCQTMSYKSKNSYRALELIHDLQKMVAIYGDKHVNVQSFDDDLPASIIDY